MTSVQGDVDVYYKSGCQVLFFSLSFVVELCEHCSVLTRFVYLCTSSPQAGIDVERYQIIIYTALYSMLFYISIRVATSFLSTVFNCQQPGKTPNKSLDRLHFPGICCQLVDGLCL